MGPHSLPRGGPAPQTSFHPIISCVLLGLFRVLTLWFDYGHWPEVNEALVEGIKTIQIDTWLQVRQKPDFNEEARSVRETR